MAGKVKGKGTQEQPWVLQTPSGGGKFQIYRDAKADPPALICTVGKTELRYHLRCLDDLHAMLKAHGEWMPLGSADEQKPAAEGTVEAWARSPEEKGCGQVRELRATRHGGAGSGRGRAPAKEQPHAGTLAAPRRRPASFRSAPRRRPASVAPHHADGEWKLQAAQTGEFEQPSRRLRARKLPPVAGPDSRAAGAPRLSQEPTWGRRRMNPW